MDLQCVYRCKGRVRGKVQAVYFRAETRRRAKALGVGGWVRNCSDGSVEFELLGSPEQLESMRTWLLKGPPLAKVDELTLEPRQRVDMEFPGANRAMPAEFSILRGNPKS